MNEKQSSFSTVKEGNIVGFILGLIGVMAWVLPIVGLPVVIVGLIFSICNIKSKKRTLNIVGTVLCSIFLIVTIINSVLGIILFINNINIY